MTTKTAPETSPATRWATRWRNVYWLAKSIHLGESPAHARGFYGPGRFSPARDYASRDVAEAMARKCLEQLSDDAAPYVTYLGAEPLPGDA
jgi:hypothetical protein